MAADIERLAEEFRSRGLNYGADQLSNLGKSLYEQNQIPQELEKPKAQHEELTEQREKPKPKLDPGRFADKINRKGGRFVDDEATYELLTEWDVFEKDYEGEDAKKYYSAKWREKYWDAWWAAETEGKVPKELFYYFMKLDEDQKRYLHKALYEIMGEDDAYRLVNLGGVRNISIDKMVGIKNAALEDYGRYAHVLNMLVFLQRAFRKEDKPKEPEG